MCDMTSVLQCVAVCCSVWLCVAVCCSVLKVEGIYSSWDEVQVLSHV